VSFPAADTNIVVRLLVRDDEAQCRLADEALASGLFLSLTVVLETEWVLRTRYGLGREDIARAFETLFGQLTVDVQDPKTVASTLRAYSEGADFADALHVAQGHGERQFLTFDQALARRFPDQVRLLQHGSI
jgi:predicted nucleic-acid-binding protein